MPKKKQFDDPNATMESGAPGDENAPVTEPKKRVKRGPKPADTRLAELKAKYKQDVAELKATIRLERLTRNMSPDALGKLKATIEARLTSAT